MRWREALRPVVMQRVALLAPQDALRDVLVGVADEGTVALDEATADADVARSAAPAAALLQRVQAGARTAAALSATDRKSVV